MRRVKFCLYSADLNYLRVLLRALVGEVGVSAP